MEKTFKQELEEFNKTKLYLYKVVTAQEVDYAMRFWKVTLTDEEYELVCNFIYDWDSVSDIPELCEYFFSGLTQGKFKIKDILDDYSKVENIIYNSF